MKEIDYDKKIALCKKLGADKFEKIIPKVEKAKFKILKNIFPGYLKRCERGMDKALERELKYATSEEMKQELRRQFQRQKMLLRKEHNFEQNRNYHVDNNNIIATIKYLKWNKEVHIKGLIKNAIAATAIAVTGIFVPQVLPLLAFEAVDAFINFQCVNNQNCNIYRFEKKRESIEKMDKRKKERNQKKYGEIAKVICKKLGEQEKANLPQPKEVHKEIKSTTELFQAMDLVIEELKQRGLIEQAEKLENKKKEEINKRGIENSKEKREVNQTSLGGKVKIYE